MSSAGKAGQLQAADWSLNLRVGEWVEVRSEKEILATLGDGQCVDGMPFMPEMLQYCGKRFRVYWSAHKTADTIELFSIRRMANAVHLKDLRCDGASHDGCQAGCLLFWKECWLKRVSEESVIPQDSTVDPRLTHKEGDYEGDLSRLYEKSTCKTKNSASRRYRCQATEVLNATQEVKRRDRWNPCFYIRDITSGNVSPVEFVRFGILAVLNSFLMRWFGWRYPRICGFASDKTPLEKLDLQPGEWVRVRPKKEIMQTLNRQSRNRGLWFDVEMVPFCDKGNYRVLRRVDRIINEKTGEMMELPNPCIILDGVTCSGNYSMQRMFSRRHEYIYWREIWLRRVDEDHFSKS
jgi:hypothetical protein